MRRAGNAGRATPSYTAPGGIAPARKSGLKPPGAAIHQVVPGDQKRSPRLGAIVQDAGARSRAPPSGEAFGVRQPSGAINTGRFPLISNWWLGAELNRRLCGRGPPGACGMRRPPLSALALSGFPAKEGRGAAKESPRRPPMNGPIVRPGQRRAYVEGTRAQIAERVQAVAGLPALGLQHRRTSDSGPPPHPK